MTASTFREELKKYRRSLTLTQRQVSYHARFSFTFPSKAEASLYSNLKGIFNKTTSLVEAFFISHTPSQFLTTDSFESDFDDLLVTLTDYAELSKMSVSVGGNAYVVTVANFLKNYTEAEIQDYLVKRIGRQYPLSSGWWTEVRETWANSLATRARGMLVEYQQSLVDLVYAAQRQGVTQALLLQQVKALNKSLTEARASFLARDLTGTLNAAITSRFRTAIGLNEYLWNTSLDEAVRGLPGGKYPKADPSHWLMQNKICKWADPSVYSTDGRTWLPRLARMPKVAPGEDWACRCGSSPYDVEILKQIDQELKFESLTP